jgi:DUF917 family protein
MGAPTVMIEKLVNGHECMSAIKAMQLVSGCTIGAIMCFEIGGQNAIEPLAVASDLGLPVVDADQMGRAFPELQMLVPLQYGYKSTPAVIVDECGSSLSVLHAKDAKAVEDIFRSHVINFMG